MKQIYTPWYLWEDYHAGMWRKVSDQDLWTERAIIFTGNTELYGFNMQIVVNEWPFAMLNNLSNPSVNKRAFLGHCAACYGANVPESITRSAWRLLTDRQRDDADFIAQKIVNEWRKKYENIFQHGNKDATTMGYQMKYQTRSATGCRLINELPLRY